MATDPILTLQDIVAGYGRMTILNALSARIERGAITTVIGPNGAGKSTLNRTISGVVRAWSGMIRFDGLAIEREKPAAIVARGTEKVVPFRIVIWP